MLLQCLNGILRARGRESAGWWGEWRNAGPVEVYREQQDEGQEALDESHSASPILSNRRTMRFSMCSVGSICGDT